MPRVYDKEGNELTEGAEAELMVLDQSGAEIPVRGRVSFVSREFVALDPRYMPRTVFLSVERGGFFHRTYTCPDLLLIDSPTEGREGARG
jgi:hypothetical protein